MSNMEDTEGGHRKCPYYADWLERKYKGFHLGQRKLMAMFTVETDYPSDTVNPLSKSVKIDVKTDG